MKRVFIVVMLLFPVSVFAQDITLQECFKYIDNNHPKADKKVLLNKSLQSKVDLLKKNLLPQVNFEAKATYQSDVVSFPFSIPNQNMEELDKDQYKASIEVAQIIYGGGITKLAIEHEKSATAVEQQQVEVSLYNIKKMVLQSFFSVLLLQQQKEVLITILEKIESKKKQLNVAVEEGVALSSELNILFIEIIKLNRQINQLQKNRQSAIQVLSQLTGGEFDIKSNFILPKTELKNKNYFVNRPEMLLLDSRNNQIVSLKNIAENKNNPKLFAFANVGYGKPGINMLLNEFDDYYIAGIGVSWKVWDWQKSKEEIKILDLNSEIIKKEKENMIKNFNIKLIQIESEIENLQNLLHDDRRIISLQKEIVKTYSAKLDNGTITMSEYIDRVNEEKQANLNFKIHTLKLTKAKIDYNMNL